MLIKKVAMCFSLVKNTRSILSTDVPKGAIESINGIRTISMTWVILGHVYFFATLSSTGKCFIDSVCEAKNFVTVLCMCYCLYVLHYNNFI